MYLINVRSFIYKCTKKFQHFHHHLCVLSINILEWEELKVFLSSSNVQVPHKQTIILHVKSSRFSLAFSLISPWQWHPGFKYPYLTCHIKISRCCCRVQMRLWKLNAWLFIPGNYSTQLSAIFAHFVSRACTLNRRKKGVGREKRGNKEEGEQKNKVCKVFFFFSFSKRKERFSRWFKISMKISKVGEEGNAYRMFQKHWYKGKLG